VNDVKRPEGRNRRIRCPVSLLCIPRSDTCSELARRSDRPRTWEPFGRRVPRRPSTPPKARAFNPNDESTWRNARSPTRSRRSRSRPAAGGSRRSSEPGTPHLALKPTRLQARTRSRLLTNSVAGGPRQCVRHLHQLAGYVVGFKNKFRRIPRVAQSWPTTISLGMEIPCSGTRVRPRRASARFDGDG